MRLIIFLFFTTHAVLLILPSMQTMVNTQMINFQPNSNIGCTARDWSLEHVEGTTWRTQPNRIGIILEEKNETWLTTYLIAWNDGDITSHHGSEVDIINQHATY